VREQGRSNLLEGERTLFEAMPQLGWVANADGWISYYNRRWYEYTGATPEEMEGWGWESVHDPELLPSVLQGWRAAIEHGQPFEMSFPIRRRDGVFRWFMTHATPLRDEQGDVVRWIGISTDINDQKRSERAMEHAVKAREDLLAIVSHELRNPLSTVLMLAKQIDRFAHETGSGLDTKKFARGIVRAVDQMNRLVSDLLDLAKLEAKQSIPMEMEKHDVVALTRQAVEAVELLAQTRILRVETDLPHGRVLAWCDGGRLLQVLAT
jgi:PAS domain S-box-containing protein